MGDNEPITRLNLGTRAYNALTSGGYQTVGDVRNASDAELRRLPQIGSTAMREIRKVCPFGRGRAETSPKTLRDEFAGLAMTATLLTCLATEDAERNPDDAIATMSRAAYKIADAMLTAREAK